MQQNAQNLDTPLPFDHVRGGMLCELQPATYSARASALGLTAALAARMLEGSEGSIIWCQLRDPERLHLHAPGLMAFGLDPARVIKVTLKHEKDLLWAVEQAAMAESGVARVEKTIVGVVGVLWGEKLYDFTPSKRLRMRAQETDTPIMLVRSHRANGITAADMRFSVAPTAGAGTSVAGVPRWAVSMTKSRIMRPDSYDVIWNRQTRRLDLAAPLRSGTASTPQPAIREPGRVKLRIAS